MAEILGYCKKCQIYGEDPRFIDVNPEHDVIICPKCGTHMTPKQAIANYDNYFENLYREAEILLFRARNYSGAYKAYAKIIDYRPEDVVARYGRILSLVYLSQLRHTYFNEALLMFKEERRKYLRNPKYRAQYFTFIKEVNKAVDKYRTLMRKRLVHKTADGREYFYDGECVSLYCHRLLQIQNFKAMFLEECDYLKTKLDDNSFAPLTDLLSSEITSIDKKLSTKIIDLDGYKYTFNSISNNDTPIIGRSDTKELKVPQKVKRKSLIEKKGYGLINDSIFYGMRTWYTVSKLAIPAFFICGGLAIVLFILSASIKNLEQLFRVLGTVSLAIGSVGILIHGAWNIVARLGNNYLLKQPKTVIKKKKK